jgi:two-component system sensor histidine kinase ArlS
MRDNKKTRRNGNTKNTGNAENLILSALFMAFKIIVFPVYVVYYLIKKLAEKGRFSIRLGLSIMHLKIIFKTLVLTGFFILALYGAYKAYFIYEVCSMVAEQAELQIEQHAKQQVERHAEQQVEQHARNEAFEHISGTEENYFAVVYDKDKIVLFSTPDPAILKGAQDKLEYRNIAGFTVINNRYFIVLNMGIFSKAQEIKQSFLFNVYADITGEINSLKFLLMIILLVNAIGLIFAFALSFAASRNTVLPIKEMAEAARSISENNMNVRLNVSNSKSELKGLAMVFNEMMDRIEDGYNRQKQFVSDVSHELRTPIAVLQGYVDMLNRWGKNDKEVLQESLDALKNETENMKDLVENLLFLARNDRGMLNLQKERFSLTNLLFETIKEMVIIDKKHKVTCNINEGIEIYADRNRIKQAVRIFLDNAIKYTPEGGEITINLAAEKRNAIIEISDTGIGMTEEEIKHIFDRFYRSDKSRKREKGGYGLGLTIAKVIVLSHKGKINVRSKPAEGTRIKVFLPVA